MKRIFTLCIALSVSATIFGQQTNENQGKPDISETIVRTPDHFSVTIPLRDMPLTHTVRKKAKEGNNKLRRNKFTNPESLPLDGVDPVRQSHVGSQPNRAPLTNFNGAYSGYMPEDPSGAVGPNHYFQAINTSYQIFDKSGTSLYGPSNLSNLFPGSQDNGDPIVMYDQAADRWFISQFGTSSNKKMYIAVSQTSDPLGAYYTYEYTFNAFPDYMKYSIWQDGYYMSANMQGQNFTVFERDVMLAGGSNARMIAKTLSVPSNGFYCTMSAYADGELPAPGTPQKFFTVTDDGWSSANTDAILIYTMTTDWGAGTATVSQTSSLTAEPFDLNFTSSWDDIIQQGSNQKLDGLVGFLMYRAAYRKFTNHSSIMLSHTVDIDGNNTAGIRWYELRDANDGNYAIYQQGTYAPNDGLSRWCPSIAIDKFGNIGMAFAIAGSSKYPSLMYTGRRESDPLGSMTIAEEVAVNGTGPITGANRFGDYAHLSMDPDDVTFWHTSEYGTSSGRRTRVYSFKIAQDLACDLGISALTAPTTGVLTATQDITVSITNFGTEAQSNVPVSYSVNGGTTVNETYTGSIAAGATVSYTFAQTTDMSSTGNYSIVTSSGLGCDMDNTNDSITTEVEHQSADNVGATAVTAPVSGTGLGATETVSVTIENFGTDAAAGFDVSFTLNSGTPVTEVHSATINAGASATYNFTTTADLSQLGNFEIVAYTDMITDGNRANDTTQMTVSHTNCTPNGDCSYGDGFTNFTLNTINNSTTCNESVNGYGDFTSMSTDLNLGSAYDFSFTSGYSEQWITVWIDYNDNFNFESNEIVVNDLQLDDNSTFNYTVPTNAAVGEHLMRGRTNWQNSSADPCAAYEYGETEDYKVNIVDPTVDVFENSGIEMIVSTIENGQFQVNLTGVSETLTLEVYNTIGQLVKSKSLNSSNISEVIDLRDQAKGAFLIKIGNKNFQKIEKVTFR